ncbi:hypothetical protein NDA11_003197 [Ustilago hordei]|uniref:Uncharacterized protein n=1 Tax=Ustilago hordei TaxID=120017 RepID=I2FZ14_USTHO|nr:uncharacterized protein UHO2_06761 [Ustilago hordei]KAJ1576862.1 hypothetical protein NDA15_001577 [Ustilago hordei]KAJ1578656.1 hypothetical protein NDA12_003911 [Ustilago hordei]KAJ1584046.1 hypothetical protein NDA11_003197 [Ustilago hordei]KAJ1599125.1 hypothetical protein NDA14_002469 [Ustilago hordei]UTT91173.1 hypothetical protein NDA17_005490 [Ustilago hordei]
MGAVFTLLLLLLPLLSCVDTPSAHGLLFHRVDNSIAPLPFHVDIHLVLPPCGNPTTCVSGCAPGTRNLL